MAFNIAITAVIVLAINFCYGMAQPREADPSLQELYNGVQAQEKILVSASYYD